MSLIHSPASPEPTPASHGRDSEHATSAGCNTSGTRDAGELNLAREIRNVTGQTDAPTAPDVARGVGRAGVGRGQSVIHDATLAGRHTAGGKGRNLDRSLPPDTATVDQRQSPTVGDFVADDTGPRLSLTGLSLSDLIAECEADWAEGRP